MAHSIWRTTHATQVCSVDFTMIEINVTSVWSYRGLGSIPILTDICQYAK